MANIPIHNETDYTLTDEMTQYIVRDAQEHFGEEVQAIRVQAGLERHAFNARTHEVRYAFSPQDFGFVHTPSLDPEPIDAEPPRSRRRSSRRDTEPDTNILPTSLDDVEDVEVDAEDPDSLETSLESLDEGPDEDEEEDDVFTLDDRNAEEDEDEEDVEVEDEEDDSFFDPDELGA